MKTGMTTGSIPYRPDVDGLRAVAVLSVIFGHLNISHFTGGFVGVDVFFVISGYLISAIVVGEIKHGCFSVTRFYERRIRRIFPALYFMLLVVTSICIIYLLPKELVCYCESLLATVGFASNFYFLKHVNYFDLPLSYPLLHTWSLAVEEQFYLIFPVILLLVRGSFGRRFRTAIVVLAGMSFAASVVLVHYNQNHAFYMLYTRAWELLIGTMLSQGMFPRISNILVRHLISIAGLGMIGYSVVTYSLDTPFPGVNAIIPCLGAALLIGAGESGLSVGNSILSLPPVVFIGLISYSLYLWHWPVIVIQEMGIITPSLQYLPLQFGNILTHHRLLLFFEGFPPFLLAAFSWRFVERPFRSGRLSMKGKRLFMMGGGLILACTLIAAVNIAAKGFPGRFPEASIRMAEQADVAQFRKVTREGICFMGVGQHFDQFNAGTCLHQMPGKRNYLLLGDSKAAMLYPGLLQTMPEVNIMQANVAHCGAFAKENGDSDCRKLSQFIFGEYLPAHPVDAILLCKHWAVNDFPSLAGTVDWALSHNQRLIVIGPNPTYDMPLPRLEAYAIAWRDPEIVNRHMDGEVKSLDEKMTSLAQTTWHVPYLSLYRAICPNGSCKEFVDPKHSIPLLIDTGHISPDGSEFVCEIMKSSIHRSLQ
jgi:peptidoglycan/LPS O-acetylase OafA/YrhL